MSRAPRWERRCKQERGQRARQSACSSSSRTRPPNRVGTERLRRNRRPGRKGLQIDPKASTSPASRCQSIAPMRCGPGSDLRMQPKGESSTVWWRAYGVPPGRDGRLRPSHKRPAPPPNGGRREIRRTLGLAARRRFSDDSASVNDDLHACNGGELKWPPNQCARNCSEHENREI